MVSQGLPETRINKYPCWLTNASKDLFVGSPKCFKK